MPHNIQQQFALCAMQNFHQIADRLFPHIQSVLTSRSSTNILAISREAALFPGGSEILKIILGIFKIKLFKLTY